MFINSRLSVIQKSMLFPTESLMSLTPFHIKRADSISTKFFSSESKLKNDDLAQVSIPFPFHSTVLEASMIFLPYKSIVVDSFPLKSS
ncbi:MAG: hypothetical protein J6S85_03490 [Methanobrevibacter sp.]|nr:hypothetical protein [Methanobrevibacter sp.]